MFADFNGVISFPGVYPKETTESAERVLYTMILIKMLNSKGNGYINHGAFTEWNRSKTSLI